MFVLVVLSSDDETEGEKSRDVPQCCSQGVHTLVSVEDAVIQGKSPQEAKQQEEASDSEDTEVGICSFSRQTFQQRLGLTASSSLTKLSFRILPLDGSKITHA